MATWRTTPSSRMACSRSMRRPSTRAGWPRRAPSPRRWSTQFWDDADGGFFDTGRDHEALIARPKSVFDNAIPAGNSVAVSVLQRLAVIYDDRQIDGEGDRSAARPVGADDALPDRLWPHPLRARFLPRHAAGGRDRRRAGRPDTAALVAVLRRRFRPNTVIALREPGRAGEHSTGAPPWPRRRSIGGRLHMSASDMPANSPSRRRRHWRRSWPRIVPPGLSLPQGRGGNVPARARPSRYVRLR